MIDRLRRAFPLIVCLPLFAAGVRPAGAQVGPELLSPLRARNIGPAGMSGRVAAIDAVASDPDVIFVGAATGGVWKSEDGGVTWRPVFDGQDVLGVGAVAVFQANPDVVWVGTGEGNPRNSAGVGNGVYRSLDGGETWTHVGLEGSERIGRIVLHPTRPDVAWVAAMGPAWNDGGQRGVYRTTDGGRSWSRVLQGNERTGAADLVIDPSNPDKLFAALWEYRRWPWFFESGGSGSGLFVSYDGGERWSRLTHGDGLPDGELGRIGLAVSRSNPDVVYALVEARKSALVRSDDGGRSWRTVSDRADVAPRPFYYADIRLDPSNENRLYSLHGRLEVSEDGGRTFDTVVPSAIIHGDVQALWIHPRDPGLLLMGNDGGVGISRDRGRTWRFVENLPLGQLYHVSVDDRVPYQVYGGMQDNGAWYGPNTVWEDRGVMNAHWRRVGGGDGFQTMDDPSDSRFGYSMSQQGSLMRFDRETGERKEIRPVHPEGEELRFNWNAALALDPWDSTTIYLGSQFVHRSRDHGDSWEIVSPDLTTDDPEKQRQDESGGLTIDATGAENHTTIVTIAPSPLEEGVIWVGTDDGKVQLTRDAGDTWTNLAARIPDVPAGTWVPHIEASHHAPGGAYVVFDDHRRGRWDTWVFRTEDYGGSWTRLSTEEVFGFAHVLEEDPVEPRLLFLGTEFGLWVSLDAGSSWMPWRHGIPAAPVRDMVVHPRDHDLVIGTHGRGIWILDDVRPLRALARDPTIASRDLHLFAPGPAQEYQEAERIGYRSTGHALFFGENQPYGAIIDYWIGSEPTRGVGARIEIRDDSGEVVRVLEGPAERGLDRVVWDLRGERRAGAGSRRAPEVVPGRYRVTVAVGDESAAGEIDVLRDPRSPWTPADRREKARALEVVASWIGVASQAETRLDSALSGVEVVLRSLPEGADSLRSRGRALRESLRALDRDLFTGPECQGICGRGTTLSAKVSAPYGTLASSGDAPTPNERVAMARARAALEEMVSRVNHVMEEEVEEFRRALDAEGFTLFPRREPLVVPEPGS